MQKSKYLGPLLQQGLFSSVQCLEQPLLQCTVSTADTYRRYSTVGTCSAHAMGSDVEVPKDMHPSRRALATDNPPGLQGSHECHVELCIGVCHQRRGSAANESRNSSARCRTRATHTCMRSVAMYTMGCMWVHIGMKWLERALGVGNGNVTEMVESWSYVFWGRLVQSQMAVQCEGQCHGHG